MNEKPHVGEGLETQKAKETAVDKELLDKYKELMGEYTGPGDTEIQHGVADTLLCDLLKILGYGEVVEVWKKVEKWYA